MRRFSLTGRIIGTVIGCQLLLTAALTLASVLYARAELRRAFDAALQGRAMSALALVRYTESGPQDVTFDPTLLSPSSDAVHKDIFEIWKANGQLVARSQMELPAGAAQEGEPFADFSVSGVPYRALALRDVATCSTMRTIYRKSRRGVSP